MIIDFYSEEGATIQWYITDNKGNDTDLDGENSKSYRPDTSVAGTSYYYAIVDGGELSITSDIVKIEVTDPDNFASGVCGSEVNWSLSSSGLLSVTGLGEINDFESSQAAPWHEYSGKINEIYVGEGITKPNDCV